jgi:hypothetical protein
MIYGFVQDGIPSVLAFHYYGANESMGTPASF